MKKKIKLFTTIASLCLAVALMAFGVYAATSVTMTISGTLSFTATEISGTWAWTAAKDDASTATYTLSETSGTEATELDITVTKVGTIKFTITGTFTNTSNKVADLVVADNNSGEGFTVTPGAASTATAKSGSTDGTGSVTVTIEFEVTDATQDLTADYSVIFTATPKN